MRILSFKIHRLTTIFTLMIFTVVFDQITKYFVRVDLPRGILYRYLGDLVRVEHTQNPGAFLSLGAGLQSGPRFWIFTVVVAGVLVAALIMLIRKTELDPISTGGLACIVGGGVGNLIDRMLFGSVTDFMNLGFGPVRTGIFNVADVAIVVGVGALILMSFFSIPEEGDSE